MAGPVVDVLVPVARLAHEFADHLYDLLVVYVVVVSTNDVGVAYDALVEYQVHGFVMVVYVNPVADLLASTVQLGFNVA